MKKSYFFALMMSDYICVNQMCVHPSIVHSLIITLQFKINTFLKKDIHAKTKAVNTETVEEAVGRENNPTPEILMTQISVPILILIQLGSPGQMIQLFWVSVSLSIK